MSNRLFISYLKLHYLDNIVMKNRIWKNFRGGARPVRPPLNPPLVNIGSGNRLAPNKQHNITRTNVDLSTVAPFTNMD